jgi:hypothetical protein
MQKNVAGQVIGVQMVNASDGSAFTGTASVAVTGDGGTQGAGGGTGPTHEGNGFHTYLPTQAETNYDHIGFTFTGSGAIPVTIQVYTRFDSNAIQIEGSDATDQIRDAVVDDATRIDASALNTHAAKDPALASVCTEARLAELGATNLPADVDTLLGRVTAAVALASVCTEARLAELDAANLPADVDTLLSRLSAARAGYLDELAAANIPADVDTLLSRLTAARAGYIDNLNGHTAQTGDSFVRLGAPAGASVSADILENQTDLNSIIATLATLNDLSISDVWTKVCEDQGSYTAQQIFSILLAACAGVTSSSGAVLKSPNGSATRITATIDGSQNRTGMVLAPSAGA